MATLEERVAALEDRLATAEHLRGLMDGDLGTVAAQTKATNDVVRALALDMGGIKTKLREHTAEFGKVNGKLGEIANGQDAIMGLLNELLRRDDDGRLDDDGVSE